MGINNVVMEDELLYRAIKRSKKFCLDGNRITPALFKREIEGISVDRSAKRSRDEAVEFMCNNANLNSRVKGIAELPVKSCKQLGTNVVAAPSVGNPYHTNIFLDENDEFRQNIQALGLADASILVFYDEKMEWT